tara:strand:+ start:787 stop:1563 length:777 start_codon:yes stop_codon:yes gene_type:complete
MVKAKFTARSERNLKAAFTQLQHLTGEPMEDILKKQGRLFAVDAARFTSRLGNKAAGGVAHRKDVNHSINHTYIRPLMAAKMISRRAGEPTGRRFSNYVRRRETAKAQFLVDKFLPKSDYKIIVGTWDSGRLHEGRLMGSLPHRMIVMDYSNVTKYRKRKVANVGEAKAGWAVAARHLGGDRGIPGYVKKGHKTKGLGRVTGTGAKAVLTVANYSPYITDNTEAHKAWKLRFNNITKVVERMVNRKGGKITRKLNRLT